MKNSLLYSAAFLILLSVTFTFDETQVNWIWQNNVPAAITLVTISILMILAHYILKGKSSEEDILTR